MNAKKNFELIAEYLRQWSLKKNYTYENKVPLVPDIPMKDGDVAIVLMNTVTFIRDDKVVKISSESPIFRYNLYSNEPFQGKLSALAEQFDEKFYKEVEEMKDQSDIEAKPLFG